MPLLREPPAQCRTSASRVVGPDLHNRFAAISGDRNPMHMDAVAARRTPAGVPVVHGVHTLLWALEELAADGGLEGTGAGIKAKFLKWIYLEDKTELYLEDRAELSSPTRPEDDLLTLQVRVSGLPVLSAEVKFGDPARIVSTARLIPSPPAPRRAALERTFEQLDGLAGEAYTAPASELQSLFPHLCRVLGSSAVSEIAACSYIVGMEAPGLHSMFSKLILELRAPDLSRPDFGALRSPPSETRSALHYQVVCHDIRFRKARIAVEGSAIEGTLDVFVRAPPVQQASMHLVKQYVAPGEFAGMHALIIGGSRGLGELTARLVAGGGGDATITYALGKLEADSVVRGIREWGGAAQAIPYVVRKPPAPQLTGLQHPPTHLFYFATSTIYKPKLGVLSAPMLAEFTQFYVQGFYDLCLVLTAPGSPFSRPGERLTVFYPSTVFLAERPAGLAEYAMIKAAGEQLCADMNLYMPELQILVHRLPKLPTDQTAGVLPERETDALEALLPLLRRMNELQKSTSSATLDAAAAGTVPLTTR